MGLLRRSARDGRVTAGLEAWVRLTLAPEIGPVLAHRLLDRFGEAAAIFRAGQRELLDVPGMGQGRLRHLLDEGVLRAARAELAAAERAGVTILPLDHNDYPELLRRLPFAPPVIWVRGRLDACDRLGLAIVGPRSPSAYARLMVDSLAPPLAAHGLTLISGLAHGVDAAVHRAALEAGGRTLAVLGQGLGTPVFPEQNRELAEQIVAEDCGALISTFPLATPPSPGLFPQRNEIIAGLALATLVVEASPTSGALITARAAQGRTVLACPGDATRRAAQGSNRLLADGAALVQRAGDVLAALGPDLRNAMAELGISEEAPAGARESAEDAGTSEVPPLPPPAGSADPVDAAVLALLAEEPLPADVLLERLVAEGHAAPRVQQRLLMLELDGRLRQLPGRIYAPARRSDG